jgi:Cdc6-like AAA superfamily ATPase
LDLDELKDLEMRAHRVFTPAKPVEDDALFAGRSEELNAIIDAINHPGQHVILYGERGVGKTSLTNVIEAHLAEHSGVVAPRVNASADDTYSSLLRRVFSGIKVQVQQARAGMTGGSYTREHELSQELPENIDISIVRSMAEEIGKDRLLILIIDEFDVVRVVRTRRNIAETIKAFSDYNVPATILLVGVGDTVTELLKEHQSVSRSLVEVQMPRMSRQELAQIVDRGMHRLGLAINLEAKERIVNLSRGLPNFTHLLGLYATLCAINSGSRTVRLSDVEGAVSQAIRRSHLSIIQSYTTATSSVRPEALFREVLLACALAPANELGWFTAAAVRDPLERIVGRRIDIPGYSRHLRDFASASRGSVLQKLGAPHNTQFRFSSPLLQPFVVLNGLEQHLITEVDIATYRG